MKKILICGFWLIAFYSVKGQTQPIPNCDKNNLNDLSQYSGRYRQNNNSIAILKVADGKLILRPLLWRSELPMQRKNNDDFVSEERAGRQMSFTRNEKGCLASVKIIGLGRDDGLYQRLEGQQTPLELLFDGKSKSSAETIIRNFPDEVDETVRIAGQLLQKFPSKKNNVVIFLESLAKQYPNNSSLFSTLGNAQIATGNRLVAKESYLKAFSLNPKDENALKGLRKLNASPPGVSFKADGWKVPFSLDDVFKKPTKAEINEVEADWKRRDLSPKNVVEIIQGKINLGSSQATVRIISHLVHGNKHFGAIIIPDGINSKAPVILDLKGVSWDYFSLDLNSIISPKILAAEQNKFIYVVPSFRGEVLQFNGREYRSEGDRTNSWDGATDDALALLNVALSIIPQADENRVCAFGKSRGGSVALLAGIRNPKIKQVLDWAAPVDWFDSMGTEGWTQKEIVAEGLLNKSAPNQEGGQFIERYMLKAIEGKWNLRDVRISILAGSSIYFAKRLPRLQIHYGIEDEMVPLKNGETLLKEMKKMRRNALNFTSFFHQNSGHDLNQRIAFAKSKKFLLQMLH